MSCVSARFPIDKAVFLIGKTNRAWRPPVARREFRAERDRRRPPITRILRPRGRVMALFAFAIGAIRQQHPSDRTAEHVFVDGDPARWRLGRTRGREWRLPR